MKKYRFSLDAVRRVRKLERDEQRLRLADAYRAEGIVRNEQAQIQKELLIQLDQRRRVANQPELEVDALLAAQRYEIALQSQKLALQKQAALLAEATASRQQAVVEAERGVRMMEKLDRRLRKAHEMEAARDETKQFDEVAQRRAAHRDRN